MTISPEENEVLSGLRINVLRDYSGQSIFCFFYGIYVVSFIFSVSLLLCERVKRPPTYALLGVTLTQFIATTIVVASEASFLATQVATTLADSSLSLQDINTFALSFGYIVGDSTIMWRAWILYPENTLARFLMSITVLINTATCIAWAATISSNVVSNPQGRKVSIDLNILLSFFSFGTNAFATFLILFKAWKFRCHMVLSGTRRRTQTESIIVLFIETGLGLSVFQLVSAVLTLFSATPGSATDYAQTTLSASAFMLEAILTTLIIIVVKRKGTSVISRSIALGTSTNAPEPEAARISQKVERDISAIQFEPGYKSTQIDPEPMDNPNVLVIEPKSSSEV